MKHIIYTLLFVFASSISLAQSDTTSVVVDTMETVELGTSLIYQVTYTDEGSKVLKVLSILKGDVILPLNDTTFILRQNDIKSAYYQRKNGEDIFYTKLPDGGRFESHRTGYPINKNDRNNILKCIYSNIKYPPRAVVRDIEGRQELEFYLNTSGCIQTVIPLSFSHDILLQETQRAAKKCDCEFPVLTKGENKYPTLLILPVSFKLQ